MCLLPSQSNVFVLNLRAAVGYFDISMFTPVEAVYFGIFQKSCAIMHSTLDGFTRGFIHNFTITLSPASGAVKDPYCVCRTLPFNSWTSFMYV